MSLTPSGLGTEIQGSAGSLDALAAAARHAATTTGVALARGLELDEPTFQRLVHLLGATVEHRFGEGRADLLRLNASAAEDKVVTGRGALPLHTDGLLVGQRPDLIVLYAEAFADLPGFGETIVCDQLSALAEMPPDLHEVVTASGLEYLVTDRRYFPTVPEDWYEIPATRDLESDGRRSLTLTLPFPPEEKAGWQVRVKGAAEAASAAFFARLGEYLHQPRYLYQHRWNVGDLLVIDNRRTLHGRTAIGPDGVRMLLRGQLTLGPVGADQ